MMSRTPARVTRSTVRNRNLSDASNLPNEDLVSRSSASSPESIVIQPLHTIVNSDNPVVFPSISGNQMTSEVTQQNIVSNAQSSNRRQEQGQSTFSTFLMDEHGVYNVEIPVATNHTVNNNVNTFSSQRPVMTTRHLQNNLDNSRNIFHNQENHFRQNRVTNTNQNQLNSNNFPLNYQYQCPIKINLPTFSGENDEDPIEYLEKLENYFRCQYIPETYQLIIVEQSLSNKALRWFGGFRIFFNNFTEFKNNFLSEYWGFNKQQKIRMQLYSDTYNNNQRKQSMADYFITIYKKCKQLNPPLHEFEFMSLIRRHFPVHVQRVLLTATIGSFVEIYNLLKELDELESNRPFNTYRPNTNNSFIVRDSRDNGEQITKSDPVKSAQTSSDYKNKAFNFANTSTHRQPNSQFVNNQGAIPKSRINSLEINYDLPSQYPEVNEIHSDVNSKNE